MAFYRIKALLADWRWRARIAQAARAGTLDETFRGALAELTRSKPQRRGRSTSVIFVCTGNICRSPYAEYQLRRLLKERSAEDAVVISSAGTDTTAGKPANETAKARARARGIDLADHRTTCLTKSLLQSADLIFGMDIHHLDAVAQLDPDSVSRSMLLGAVSLPATPSPIIADPYGLPDSKFDQCFAQIDIALAKLVEEGQLF